MVAQSIIRRRLLSWRWSLRVVLGLAMAYLAGLAVLMAFEDRIIYHPVPAARRWNEARPGWSGHDLTLKDRDGHAIHARWFPAASSDGAVLICHGQAGNVSLECGPRFLTGWQHTVRVSVLVFDYPGYGRSEGRPSEAGCYAAADAAYVWLTEVQQVPAERVLIYGRSLGTGVAVDLASRRTHRGLVLVSPYTSLPDVAIRRFGLLPAPLVMRNRFDSAAKIGLCRQPVFMLHGTDDHVIPFALGQKLFGLANEPKRFVPVEGAHHGSDVLTPSFFEAVRDFLATTDNSMAPR